MYLRRRATELRSRSRTVDDVEFEMDEAEDGTTSIDPRFLIAFLYRNRLIILGTVAAAMILGALTTLLMPKVYTAAASVQLEQQSARVLQGQDLEPPNFDAERFLNTQADLLRSRTIAERVAHDIGAFTGEAVLKQLGVKPGSKDDPETLRAEREAVLDALARNLSVSLPRNTRVARISYDNMSPSLAAAVANSYAENLIAANFERRLQAFSSARGFLEKELTQARQRLEDSERQLINYAREAGLVDASAGVENQRWEAPPRSLVASQLVLANDAYAAARRQRLLAEQRWRQASRLPALAVPEVLTNDAVQDLLFEQAVRRNANVDRQLSRLAGTLKSSLRQEYQSAAADEASLARQIDVLKQATLNEQTRLVRYNILRREVETNRSLHDGLLQRYKEIMAQSGLTPNNIIMVDRAEAPRDPSSPRPMLNMALSGFGGFCLALLFAFSRERFDDAIHATEDVERKLGIPVLGVVPVAPGDQDPIVSLKRDNSSVAEAYLSIRTAIELAASGGAPRSLLFTSSGPGEGKSTSAYALAEALSRLGRKVLLVDADMRKPAQHRILGGGNSSGFSNLLAGIAHAEDAIQPTGAENLYFLAAGPKPPKPVDLLTGEALPALLKRLGDSYDIVVIDGPPVMGLADAPLIGAAAEATCLVVETNRAHRGRAKLALRRLAAARAHVLGAILTKFDVRKSGYGSGFAYDYDYGADDRE